MSVQDKMERILKDIHLLFSKSRSFAGDVDSIVISKQEALALLEKLNFCVNEMMEQYEVTLQSRELAKRRSEKDREEILKRATAQVEDVYAASLLYTEDALHRIQDIIEDASGNAQRILTDMNLEFEKERGRVKGNQKELREQLQDLRASNKYINMLDECNREREKAKNELTDPAVEKRIQNEARHFSKGKMTEIKVNPAYVPLKVTKVETSSEISGTIPVFLEEESPKSLEMPEIKVDLDAEYFKWKVATGGPDVVKKKPIEKKERKFMFIKK